MVWMEGLQTDPFQRGDFQVKDAEGREQHLKLVAGFRVTFYADHAVREVRVTDLESG